MTSSTYDQPLFLGSWSWLSCWFWPC